MKPAPFDYLAAASVEEAVAALAAHADDAVVLAGGQSLVPLLNLRLARPSVVVDVNRIAALAGIGVNGVTTVGALTRQAAALRSPLLAGRAPLLVVALGHAGHVATRARGTVGGSAAHADPAAELPAVLLALDAAIVLRGPAGEREVAAADFFQGPFTTARRSTELLTAVRLPAPPPGARHGFHEVARRHGDFALAGAAVVVAAGPGGATGAAAAAGPGAAPGAALAAGAISHVRIALFGVAPCAFRAVAAEAALAAGAPAEEVAALAAAAAEPHDDIHATASYRRRAVHTCVVRALAAAAAAGPGAGEGSR